MNDQERKDGLEKLRQPFPDEAIGSLPKGGTMLSYVGHANVTDRLLSVDPEWNWEPLVTHDNGQPVFDLDAQGRPIGLWITLTVCGVTRRGYGSVAPNAFDPIKQLIGDALRNAAMRFGVALQLWSKEELEFSVAGAQTVASPSQAQQAPRSQEVLTPPPSQSASPPQQSVPASPRPENGNRSGHGGNGDVPPAVASPIDDTAEQLSALIEARIASGDVSWSQVRGKAVVAAARVGDTPPAGQASLKNMSPEALRQVLAAVGKA